MSTSTTHPSSAPVSYERVENGNEAITTITRQDFFNLLKQPHPKKWSARSQQMHKVSPPLRADKQQSDVYDPIMVSLGPYHHGKQNLSLAEESKYLCLHWCAGESELNKPRFYNRILSKIGEVKACYAQDLEKDDKDLALMMLLDSCFILNFMENITGKKKNNWHNCLGVAAAIPFAARDIMLLENQIPLFVLMLLINAKYDKEEGRVLVQMFLSWMLSVDLEQAIIPREYSDPPLHILEACWRIISAEKPDTNYIDLEKQQWKCSNISCFRLLLALTTKGNNKKKKKEDTKINNHRVGRSVSDLKSKGISFVPSSSSHSLRNIEFKSHMVFGTLQLPVRSLSDQTQVILSNMIAYEMSPYSKTQLEVLSYTNFMKSLIETPADVKELQEKGIFQLNRFANLEQVVHLFQNIDTFGLQNSSIYEDVMHRVGEHCNHRRNTWIAELFHSKLSSPWTIISLIAAALIVVLTFMQTYKAFNS